MNLIVTCARHREPDARQEVGNILDDMGDPGAEITVTEMSGILVASTALRPESVVYRIRQMLDDEPWSIRYCLRVIPIQRVVDTDMEKIRGAAKQLYGQALQQQSAPRPPPQPSTQSTSSPPPQPSTQSAPPPPSTPSASRPPPPPLQPTIQQQQQQQQPPPSRTSPSGATYRISVEKRNSNLSSKEIISGVAGCIGDKVSLDSPDRIILVEVLGGVTGISVLDRSGVLSVEKTKRGLSDQ